MSFNSIFFLLPQEKPSAIQGHTSNWRRQFDNKKFFDDFLGVDYIAQVYPGVIYLYYMSVIIPLNFTISAHV